MTDYRLKITYKSGNEVRTASSSCEDFDIKFDKSENGLSVALVPIKSPITIIECELVSDYEFAQNSRFFANGFQSWTDSAEFKREDIMPWLGTVGKSPIGSYLGLPFVGDYNFAPKISESGVFRSHSYSYVRNGKQIDFFGSLNDRTGYTMIVADMNSNELRFYKELEGVSIDSEYKLFELFFDSGEYDKVFDSYFAALKIKPRTLKQIHGYTSWYNYYQNISSSVILRDLQSISKVQGVDTFQIDDGYQTAVGDWMSVDIKKFPSGMKAMADAIHSKGLSAGLWLAPFGAQKGSFIAKTHPDWLIKDENGSPICVGANWGGFYALNIYKDGVREYLKRVFDTVLNIWGFDLVKLDFLYAASIVPMCNKSRGEIAYDAMDLLRECVGDKRILGCGCQMMPAFGKVDYMRIGADMALSWKHNLLRRNMHREDVSTPNAIKNSIYRRSLDRRAFLNDTDVFLLRDTNISFTEEQRELLAKFIQIFGSVLFTSDDVSSYTQRQMSVLNDIISGNASLVDVSDEDDIVTVNYIDSGTAKTMSFNLNDGTILRL